MTTTFDIPSTAEIPFKPILDALGNDVQTSVEGQPDLWPSSPAILLVPNRTAQPVSIEHHDDRWSIAIGPFSHPVDWQLGISLTHTIAHHCNAPQVIFEDQSIETARLDEVFNDQWVQQHVTSAGNMIRALVDYQDEAIGVTSPGFRTFHAGRRVVERLKSEGDDETFGLRLCEAIARNNFFDPTGFAQFDKQGQATHPLTGEQFTWTHVAPELAHLAPLTDRWMLATPRGGDDNLGLPIEHAPAVFGDTVEWLDEKWAAVSAIDTGTYLTIWERAQPHVIKLDPSQITRRKWFRRKNNNPRRD